MVIAIFAVNVYLKRPVMDSFLFSLALAVGLTPQLLPAIISINLAHGAREMARRKVIVKRLASIENFRSMNVLCSDKTGTLTEGIVKMHSALDVRDSESQKVLLYAYLNAIFETGFTNPIDEAIRSHKQLDVSGYVKAVPNWLVSGICCFSFGHCPGYPHPKACSQKQTWQIFADSNSGHCLHYHHIAAHPPRRDFWVSPAAILVLYSNSFNSRSLRDYGRSNKTDLL